jgi:hypothetical protein
MIQKNFISLLCLTLLISGCAGFGAKRVDIVSKPIEIDIIQPDLPRPVNLTAPKWYVVSTAKITNPCKATIPYDPVKLDEKGNEKFKRPKACSKEETENPEWPDNYTYLDRFLDDMKTQNNGEILFVATTVGDYKVMAEDMQELKRYIKQLGEVVVYYRNVTIKNSDGTTEEAVGISNTNDDSNRPSIGLFPRNKDKE